jgi:NADH-quinone oxidoreductase subunit F
MPEEVRIVFENLDMPGIRGMDVYEKHGGYRGLRRALKEFTPQRVADEVKASGLRGKGGAGFPTGVKWSFVPKGSTEVYLVVNGDESEPGTFKDRQIMRDLPHRVIEGAVIASYAIGCRRAYIYVRGEMPEEQRILNTAIAEARARGYVGKDILGSGFDVEVVVHSGAGAYICGEETSLLESLEGKRGFPKLKPPFPAVAGLYERPTIINNVETIATVPAIIQRGAAFYAQYGTEKSRGTKIFCVSGHVAKPGNYEFPLGTPMEVILEHAGGVRGGRKLKAVIPGGSSTPIMPASQVSCPMDFESVAAAGSMLGCAAMIVMDETTDIPAVIEVLARFYADESCGKCTPCREGTTWFVDILHRINNGRGRMEDIDLLNDICKSILNKVFCPLGDAAVMPVESAVRLFRDEFEAKIRSAATSAARAAV